MQEVVDRPSAARGKGVHLELVKVTPSLAASWLDKNKNNRPQNTRHITRLAADMRSGHWKITGDTIKFDRRGNLIDGQHRLRAVIVAETAAPMFVAYGIETAAQDVIDTGKIRTPGNVLAIHGVQNSNNVATAYRILYQERRGGAVDNVRMAPGELIAVFEKHPHMGLYVPSPGTMPKGVSIGAVGFLNYVSSVIMNNAERGGAMVKVLRTGVPDYDGDPIHRYRERVIGNAPWLAENGAAMRNMAYNTLKYAFNAFLIMESVPRLPAQREHVHIRGLKLSEL